MNLTIDFNPYVSGNRIYDIINYSAGEYQVRINPEHIESIEESSIITIRAMLAAAKEPFLHENLMKLLLLSDALHGINQKAEQRLELPYLPYSRGDRRFVDGDCHGLATFGCVLRAGEFREVVTLDVHSPSKAGMFIDNLINVYPVNAIKNSLEHFQDRIGTKGVTVLFPDAGASRRYKKIMPEGIQCLHASKKRNPVYGVFEGFEVPAKELYEHNAVLIVDDLCDAGGTFFLFAEISIFGLVVTL